MVDWRALAVQLDAEVDATWGERIRVTPWKSGTFDAGVHDASRPIIDSVGELFFVAEQVGAGGGTNVTGFALRISEIDIRLSCASAPLRAAGARQGDHIDALDSSDKFEIVSIAHDGTGRASVKLLRKK
jgi:hypothetical protein